MPATDNGAALFESLRPELLKAFRDIPAFGSIGFRVHFAEGEVSRIEYEASLSRRLSPKVSRS
jgi:hypothetical protein